MPPQNNTSAPQAPKLSNDEESFRKIIRTALISLGLMVLAMLAKVFPPLMLAWFFGALAGAAVLVTMIGKGIFDLFHGKPRMILTAAVFFVILPLVGYGTCATVVSGM